MARSPGLPTRTSLNFSADSNADYLLIVESDAQALGTLIARLNGKQTATVPGGKSARISVSVASENVLDLEYVGQPGAGAVVYVLGGANVIGRAGGTVRGPNLEMHAEVGPGTFDDPTVVQLIRDDSVEPQTFSAAQAAARLIMPLPSSPTARITMRSSPPSPAAGLALWHRLIVRDATGATSLALWNRPTESGDGSAFVSFGAADFDTMKRDWRTQAIDIAFHAHTFPDDRLPAATQSARQATASLVTTSIVESATSIRELLPSAGTQCVTPTRGIAPAPCNQRILEQVAGPTSGSGQTAIVLIHGWNRDVADGGTYLQSQGCAISIYPMPGVDCGAPQFPASPGMRTWQPGGVAIDWIDELAKQFPAAPIYLMHYETFYDYAESGSSLAGLLAQRAQTKGYSGYVLIGHSMGGLVARVAATQNVAASLVKAVITLGTPHFGTPIPAYRSAQSYVGVTTRGGQSLLRPFNRFEKAPLYVHAGKLAQAQVFVPFSVILSQFQNEFPENDGVVPTCSALVSVTEVCTFGTQVTAPKTTGFVSAVTRWPLYARYDHLDMSNGNVQSGQDPLLLDVIEDLRAHMPSPYFATAVIPNGTPNVDGNMGLAEWSNAHRITVPVTVSGAGSVVASVYVLHDDSNIYFALKIPSPIAGALVQRQVLFWLDFWANASTGPWPQHSSESLVFSKWDATNPSGKYLIGPGRLDDWAFRSPCPLGGSGYCGTWDTRFGGTIDGFGTSTVNDAEFFVELTHPLKSSDTANDFQLRTGDTVGMYFEILLSGTQSNGSGTPNTHAYYPSIVGGQRTWLGLNLR
jgi:pimeloyl-ACP methyl ester carboxylesterase